ncbi:glycosyltransferase family 2 protein [Cryobacterium tagatosivorans]|uniref:Glycosyltransferase family 2 protein n=1 Tax=Cryobacterium tagatosivorans TaxID=1259199 RepID=A0A4R8UC70_9MICO|nr:glycosyltransferase [Cryobacterium tagatosivorans]TFB47787.1 glycosyltransferase family 2 protein [Cryobacterium tagatosivorans]
MRFEVIVACHNRRELTLHAFERAQIAASEAKIEVAFTLYDDGSVDGTSDAVSASPHAVRILHGDGTAFWAQSMALAEAAVLASSPSQPGTYLIWLNDDVILDGNAFRTLSLAIDEHPSAVIVGAMRDLSTGEVTYSGMRRKGRHPLSFELVKPSSFSQPVETFNGNLVAVPLGIARTVGGIDGGFSHALADIDYGLRCGRAGVPVLLAPGTLGTCSRNATSPRASALVEWRAFTGPKGGGNFSSQRRILRKSNRRTWLVVVAISYGLWWVRRLSSVRPVSRLTS